MEVAMHSAHLTHVKHRIAEAKLVLSEIRLARILRKYSPAQPRVPAGNPDAGQWTSDGSGDEGSVVLASGEYSMGNLLAEIPLFTGGRYCVYRFDFADVAVQGPNYARCQPMIPSSAAVHGRFINDNRR
jgi:hypothetical protein